MVQFWVDYVLAKEKLGVIREVSLTKIQAKYGEEFKNTIEQELNKVVG